MATPPSHLYFLLLLIKSRVVNSVNANFSFFTSNLVSNSNRVCTICSVTNPLIRNNFPEGDLLFNKANLSGLMGNLLTGVQCEM